MKKIYLALALIGFISPNYLMFLESLETGNILLYADFSDTLQSMFANRISTIFSIDLMFAVFVFFVWSFSERQKIGLQRILLVWVFTMLFGLAGAFPLFLYTRESSKIPLQAK